MSPFFTIIIPTREINDLLIEETLPAIDKQTYRSFEVLIAVDSKSSTEAAILKQYPWLSIFHNEINNRPGDKRDKAAKKAKGEILVFIDDDVYPTGKWLEKAYDIFTTKPEIAALGGPGMLPEQVNIWERIFDAVLQTWVGSGSYVYRFTPRKQQFVDDYPTMNLMIRQNVFHNIGGFDNQHWPGEDSKLLNKFIVQEKKFILYHPEVTVFHHRRDSLLGHLQQHKNYGKTRGTFAAQGDQNSTHLMYVIPALFTLYIALLLILSAISLWHQEISIVFNALAIGLYLYIGLLLYVFFESYLKTENLLIALGAILVIPLTHLTYGFWFIVGYVREKINV